MEFKEYVVEKMGINVHSIVKRKDSKTRWEVIHISQWGVDIQNWDSYKPSIRQVKPEVFKKYWVEVERGSNLNSNSKFKFITLKDNTGMSFGGYILPQDKRIKHLDVGIGDIVTDGKKYYAIEDDDTEYDDE